MKKTVLITGCSSGIGKTTAQYFARQGWNVLATMRQPEAARDLADLPGVSVARLDVQDQESIGQAIGAGIDRFGKIDAVINNAGFGVIGLFETLPRKRVQEQFDVNFFGVMDVTRAILPHFRANGAGVVVNISSGAGVITVPLLSIYCASKFALEGLSEGLYYELASQNIAVKIIELGTVASTNFVKRSAEPVEGCVQIRDYDRFMTHANAILAEQSSGDDHPATEEEVAAAIFGATTDGTNRLRYVATADIVPLLTARRETSEENYMAFMRSLFMPKS